MKEYDDLKKDLEKSKKIHKIMWAVAKIKLNEIALFRKQIEEKIGKDTIFYMPKTKIQLFRKNKLKSQEKFVLENYIFCFNKKFENQKTFQVLRFIKGLQYFLPGCLAEQKKASKVLFVTVDLLKMDLVF